jgi:hypothetical protein
MIHATSSWSGWRRRLGRAVIAVACILVLLEGTDLIWSLSSAGRFFHLMAGLTPGKSSLADAKQLLRYRSFAAESVPCTGERCFVQFLVERRLSRWHLAGTRRGFLGYVDVRDNVVQSIRFSYAEGDLMYVEATEGPSAEPQERPGLPVGLYVVALSPSRHKSVARATQFADMSVDARAETLQPNVWCLVKPGGCQTPQSILPGTRSLTFEP